MVAPTPYTPARQMEAQTAQRLQRAEADAIAVRQQLEAAQAAAAELQVRAAAVRPARHSRRAHHTLCASFLGTELACTHAYGSMTYGKTVIQDGLCGQSSV